MHEAALARSIAEALLERMPEHIGFASLRDPARDAPVTPPVRVLVRGGQTEPTAFDAALLEHLRAELPGWDGTGLEVVHEPAPRLCVGCGSTFEATVSDAPCPSCGAMSSLPTIEHEQVELEVG